MTAIEFENVSKQYRLGLVGTQTLAHDLRRFWITNIRGKEDPYLKIGETNDRATKGNSDYVWALRDINFKVEQGDVLGIIGKNGAGKSTLLKLLSRVTGPTTGAIRARGRIGSLLEVGTGFHPEMTGRENIYMNGAILGMTRREIDRKLDEIIDFSGCERYIDTPVKRYSSGMTVRLGFAVAAHLEPEILVVDEVLAVGDIEFQKKAIGKMKDVSRGEGRTVLFVSHNMASVRSLCTRGMVLEKGRISFEGTADAAVAKYLALNEGDNNVELKDRKDRFGNGKLRVVGITLRNKAGEEIVDTFVGDYLKVDFHLEEGPEPVDYSKMIVCIKIYNGAGDVVTMWTSDEMNSDFSGIQKGIFSLEIPALNLRPNLYFLGFEVFLNTTSDPDCCDYIINAKDVSVINSPFFGPKTRLKEGRGHLPLMVARYIA